MSGKNRMSRPCRPPMGRRRARAVRTGLMGGSFNPAHAGHRHVALAAIRALDLDELWWLVSPGNPLKAEALDMAPLAIRLASARMRARRSRIRATALEAVFATRYTVDTVRTIQEHWPRRQFIWIMGSDNLALFHRWRQWRRLALRLPIAVVARPGSVAETAASPAAVWLRRFVHPARHARDWPQWPAPALVLLHCPPDARSSTAIRRANPDWARAFAGLAKKG